MNRTIPRAVIGVLIFLLQSSTPFSNPFLAAEPGSDQPRGSASRSDGLSASRKHRLRKAIRQLGHRSYEIRQNADRTIRTIARGSDRPLQVAGYLKRWRRTHEVRNPERNRHLQELVELLDRKLQLMIKCRKKRISPGTSFPVELVIKNRSRQPVHVLPALDGSEAGWIYPVIHLEIRRNGKPVGLQTMKRCGVHGGQAPEDLQRIAPGASYKPFQNHSHWKLNWQPKKPGTYTLKWTYDLSWKNEDRIRIVPHQNETDVNRAQIRQTLMRKTVHGKFESNTVRIRVVSEDEQASRSDRSRKEIRDAPSHNCLKDQRKPFICKEYRGSPLN